MGLYGLKIFNKHHEIRENSLGGYSGRHKNTKSFNYINIIICPALGYDYPV